MKDQPRSLRVTLTLVGVMLLAACGGGHATASPIATMVHSTNSGTVPDASAADSTHVVQLAGGALTLPTGFTISAFATNLGAARFMAVRSTDGTLFVADARGRILALPDANRAGKADRTITFASNLRQPTSIAFYQDWLYIGETDRVSRFRASDNAMQAQGAKETVVQLPAVGQHWTRTVGFGPDGKLYVAVGSDCNVCEEQDQRRAAINVYDPDGANGRVFASGLRNAVGFAWQPGTTIMWATVNGRDNIGDDVPPDELRIVRDGSFNGWPYCNNGTTPNPEYKDASRCGGAVPAEVALQAHSAALGLTFGDQLNAPQPYKDSMYIAYHGSWNRSTQTGYKVMRVPITNGQAGQPEDFVTGWLPGSPDVPGSAWGRPTGVTVGSDGALYVSDDTASQIYRIAAAG